MQSNNVIDSLSQVPQALLTRAGIEPGYRNFLKPAAMPTSLPAFIQYP